MSRPVVAQDATTAAGDHVVILLALFNGARTLREQLVSLVDQTYEDWSLIVSDDGSTDGGPGLVRAFAKEHPGRDITLCDGPCMGFAQNFLHLLRQVPDGASFVSFCDQDDVWLPSKTARAVAALNQAGPGTPAMYCGRTVHCSETLDPIRVSALFTRKPGFRNALLQNIGGGNTVVLNAAAAKMLRSAAERVEQVVSHDWWMYQMISGAGGAVYYEKRPGLYYRQHDSNAVGANGTARTALHRVAAVLRGRYRDWNDINITALEAASEYLTPKNIETLEGFRKARQAGLLRRIVDFRRLALYRQSRRGNVALWLAILVGRV